MVSGAWDQCSGWFDLNEVASSVKPCIAQQWLNVQEFSHLAAAADEREVTVSLSWSYSSIWWDGEEVCDLGVGS